MAELKPLPKRIIWAFAVGYFFFYAPYAGTVKIISSGGRSAFEIFPSVVLGTLLGIVATLTLLGWWRYARVVREPRRLLSGVATASQWGATTIMYTFSGISIVLAVLLMRAGVLTLAPVVDVAHKRRVRWFSWVALFLAIVAVIYALVHVEDYALPLLAAINLGFYLAGYAVRLPTMTRQAKTRDRDCTQQYFVDETYEYPVVAGIADPDGYPAKSELEGPAIDLTDLDSLEATQALLTDLGLLS
jgi:xanthosine utilization system XapX-like protein